MPRRRYRLFTVFAVIIVVLLYRTLQNSWQVQQPRPAAAAPLQQQPSSHNTLTTPAQEQTPLRDGEKEQSRAKQVAQEVETDGYIDMDDVVPQGSAKWGPAGVDGPTKESSKDVKAASDSASTSSTKTFNESLDEIPLQDPPGDSTSNDETTSLEAPKPTRVHWTRPREHFPLPKESIITLPTAAPKKIPRIQHVFPVEADVPKKKRLERQAVVKEAIQRSWAAYRKYAWKHDELLPVSNGSRDPFCGWAATLVDSLDTLWIAGLKAEFDEAAKAAREIDFTYTSRGEIPVFETTIRYLGGLIAAYDVSGGASGKYSFLLDKAVELAEILMGIFDTPNRMPILFYQWRLESASQPHRAGRAGMAELATLSLEFTRLAQLTGQHKYYDAIDRITNGLIEMQRRGTLVPGLFPESLDVSGCNLTAANPSEAMSNAAKAQVDAETPWGEPEGYDGTEGGGESTKARDGTSLDDILERRAPAPVQQKDVDAALSTRKPDAAKSQFPIGADGSDSEWDCVPQGFVPGGFGYQTYHMGGGQDSAYEYFGKEYLLLGGREPKYQKLYEDAIEGINKHLLFRPMVKGDWDIIFPAKVGLKSSGEISNVQYEVAHLTCFIGGMYALGGKMFGREKDLAYAKKFTDGCVWAYQSTATGIMAEGAEVLPCPTFEKCSFNETAWWQSLDPLYGSRDGQVREWEDDQVEIQRFYKQEAERQREEMESGKDTTTPGAIDTGDGEASSQKVVGGSAAPSNSAPDESKFLNKRAAISVEPENVALSSDELRSSRHAYGAAKSDKDDDSAQKVKMSDPSGSGSQQTPSTEAKSAKPASQQEYHSRPDPPRIPHNRHPSSRWSTKPLSHEQFVQGKIKDGVPPGYSSVSFPKYILRPEAIESVWYMYRITGDPSWMEKGWTMFKATMRATRTSQAHSAIDSVLQIDHSLLNEMESFWLAETLKYYYLLFSDPRVISLDEWVLNTEAHPFKLQTGDLGS